MQSEFFSRCTTSLTTDLYIKFNKKKLAEKRPWNQIESIMTYMLSVSSAFHKSPESNDAVDFNC